MSIYEILGLFFIYSFLGWCTEVLYATFKTGEFVNRGFLNGPVCPIYGMGITAVSIILYPIRDNLILLFIGSVLVTSILEFITGLLLEKLFKNQWWDYSEEKFNLKGYICLKFSIIWGISCTVLMLLINPIILKILEYTPRFIGIFIISICFIVFVIDSIITGLEIIKFNEKLKLLDEITQKIRFLSDEIGENISDGMLEVMEIVENREEYIENITDTLSEGFKDRKEELSELKKKYKTLVAERLPVQDRLLKAFPTMKSKVHKEILDNIKIYYKLKNSIKKQSKKWFKI